MDFNDAQYDFVLVTRMELELMSHMLTGQDFIDCAVQLGRFKEDIDREATPEVKAAKEQVCYAYITGFAIACKIRKSREQAPTEGG